MTSIKGVLFLGNIDGEMKWFNGDSGNEVKYEGDWKDGKPWTGIFYDKNGNISFKVVNGK